MLKKKDIQDWASKKAKQLQNYLDDFCTTFDKEDLHQLRVNIKKIRAFIFLLELTAQDNKPSFHKKELKELFKHAGRIRDAQLHLLMAEEYQLNNPVFISQQQQIEFSEKQLFCHKKEEYREVIKMIRDDFYDNAAPVSNKEGKRVITEEWERAHFYLSGIIDTGELHDRRKIVKQIIHMLGILPDEITLQLQINTDYLDEIADKVGKWHDTTLVVALLKEQNMPVDVLKDLEQKAEDQLTEIRSLLSDFDLRSRI
jgi:CHAD domain-containing protein